MNRKEVLRIVDETRERGDRPDLRNTDLIGADLSNANLIGANLSGADLSGADLRRANLRNADLSNADLSGVKLRWSELRRANLRNADLSNADLRCADLRGANLSEADGFFTTIGWIADNFEFDRDDNLIVYRAQRGEFESPDSWTFEPGSILTENCNPDRGTLCACGVSFGTREWVERNCPNDTLWRCIIPPQWLAGIVVPFGTDGKARCERLELVEVVG